MLLNVEKKTSFFSIPVISIDGPSSSGKGTISCLLAQDLAWHFLDSGAIYRIAAWVAAAAKIPFEEESLLPIMADLERNISVRSIAKRFRIFWQQQDITESIRTEAIGQLASKLGTYPKIRQSLLAYQRSFRRAPGLVADGRDMGSVVFPDAKLKIFLDASLEERAKRRYLQLKAKGKHVSLSAVRAELGQRDHQDRQRLVAPLIVPTGAIVIDTTHLSIQEVLQLIKSKLSSA